MSSRTRPFLTVVDNGCVPASKSETRVFPGSYDRVFRAVCDAAHAEGMTVGSADPAAGHIYLTTNMTLMTWGENLGVTLRPNGSGVEVTVGSALKFGLVDWGRNGENINKMFYRIGALLTGPAGTWHPDPSGRHELRWWDGRGWTANVSDGGQPGVDPL